MNVYSEDTACPHCGAMVLENGTDLINDPESDVSGCGLCVQECEKCGKINYRDNMTGIDICWDCYHLYETDDDM